MLAICGNTKWQLAKLWKHKMAWGEVLAFCGNTMGQTAALCFHKVAWGQVVFPQGLRFMLLCLLLPCHPFAGHFFLDNFIQWPWIGVVSADGRLDLRWMTVFCTSIVFIVWVYTGWLDHSLHVGESFQCGCHEWLSHGAPMVWHMYAWHWLACTVGRGLLADCISTCHENVEQADPSHYSTLQTTLQLWHM